MQEFFALIADWPAGNNVRFAYPEIYRRTSWSDPTQQWQFASELRSLMGFLLRIILPFREELGCPFLTSPPIISFQYLSLRLTKSGVFSFTKMKCVALISGGKDSWFNIMQCVANGHEIAALANLRPLPAHPGISFQYSD